MQSDVGYPIRPAAPSGAGAPPSAISALEAETMRKVSHARKKKSEPEGCAGVEQRFGREIMDGIHPPASLPRSTPTALFTAFIPSDVSESLVKAAAGTTLTGSWRGSTRGRLS